jgi:hypothetical protein
MAEQLPTLPFYLARSFWATVLTAVFTVANALQIDMLQRLGIGEGDALAALDALLPVATAFWAWLERRNPGYRLTVR